MLTVRMRTQIWYSANMDLEVHVNKPTDPFHKPHNAPVLYPRMKHFLTETRVHISVSNGALWYICLMHCEMGLFKWDGSHYRGYYSGALACN